METTHEAHGDCADGGSSDGSIQRTFGYASKFSIVAVDRITFERTPKPSTDWLAGIMASNELPNPEAGRTVTMRSTHRWRFRTSP